MADIGAPTAYRKFTLGDTLAEAIEQLTAQGKLNNEANESIMRQYDKSIIEALSKHTRTRVVLKGSCNTYNHVNSVHSFLLENAQFKIDSQTEKVDRVRIVCFDAKLFTAGSNTQELAAPSRGASASKRGSGSGKKKAAPKRKRKQQKEDEEEEL